MELEELDWDDENTNHIAHHGVTAEEVEEVLCFRPYLRRTRQGRYLAFNQTVSGRFLFVVFEYKGKKRGRPITARDMDAKERRAYRRLMGAKR